MTAGALHDRHLLPVVATSGSPARDHRADFDDIVIGESSVAGHECSVADHQVRFAHEIEVVEQPVHRAVSGHVDLALGVAHLHQHQQSG